MYFQLQKFTLLEITQKGRKLCMDGVNVVAVYQINTIKTVKRHMLF
jgi:hypothetical protein